MLVINGFSPNMLPAGVGGTVTVRPLEGGAAQAAALLEKWGVESAVGHADTAALFTDALGIQIPCERRTVTLRPGDMAILGGYRGPRLPEGATTLPAGAEIEWHLVTVSTATPVRR